MATHTPPHDMPDFETMVSAVFRESSVNHTNMHIPAGRMGVQPSRCDNPACEDHCPSVWLTVRLPEKTLDLQFDAHIAVGLASIILHAAHVADPKLKEGAN